MCEPKSSQVNVHETGRQCGGWGNMRMDGVHARESGGWWERGCTASDNVAHTGLPAEAATAYGSPVIRSSQGRRLHAVIGGNRYHAPSNMLS